MRQKVLSFAIITYLWTSIAGHCDALSNESKDWMRMRFSGEQRYLIEKISKSTCFAMANVNAELNRNIVRKAVARFTEIAAFLSAGDKTQGLSAEQSIVVLAAFSRFEKDWPTFGAASLQIAAGDLHSVAIREILELGPKLANDVEASFQAIEAVYHMKTVSDVELARSVDVAASQKVLAMRLAKEFCFFTLDIQREEMKSGIQATAKEFLTFMHAMEEGNYDMGVIPPPNEAATQAMHEMSVAWLQTAAILHAILAAPETGFVMFDEMGYQAIALGEAAQTMVDIYLE